MALSLASASPVPLAGLSGDSVRHFSKALSSVLRGDMKYEWADTHLVVNRVRSSRRHGSLTLQNLPDVLLNNHRFEVRVSLQGVAQIRASR